jgi:hypothetical protein
MRLRRSPGSHRKGYNERRRVFRNLSKRSERARRVRDILQSARLHEVARGLRARLVHVLRERRERAARPGAGGAPRNRHRRIVNLHASSAVSQPPLTMSASSSARRRRRDEVPRTLTRTYFCAFGPLPGVTTSWFALCRTTSPSGASHERRSSATYPRKATRYDARKWRAGLGFVGESGETPDAFHRPRAEMIGGRLLSCLGKKSSETEVRKSQAGMDV